MDSARTQGKLTVGAAKARITLDISKAALSIIRLDQIFKVMIYGDEVKRGKPAPDICLEALKQLGLAPAASLSIEDSANGLRSLKADARISALEDFTIDLVRAIERKSRT